MLNAEKIREIVSSHRLIHVSDMKKELSFLVFTLNQKGVMKFAMDEVDRNLGHHGMVHSVTSAGSKIKMTISNRIDV